MYKTYTRKLSFNERIYIAGDGVRPPVMNQFFLDGHGDLDVNILRRAVEAASDVNPGSRLILKGYLGASRWVDSGVAPPVSEIDGSSWDGMGPVGAPDILMETISVRKGPTCEVFIIHGKPQRLLFRTHHSVMDGRGTLHWMADIFRSIRKEPLEGSYSTLTDIELARRYQKEFRTSFPFDNIAPTGMADGDEKGVTWLRKVTTGKYHNLLGQLAVLSAKQAWQHKQGKFRISVPVDMRNRTKGERSTGNLTFPIYLEVLPDSEPEDIARDVSYQIRDGREMMLDKGDAALVNVPIWAICHKWNASIPEFHRKGLYRTSGLISNFGRVPLNLYSGGGFTTDAFWAIPPSYDHIPFFIGVFGSPKNKLEMTCSIPKVLATKGRLGKFMDDLMNGLVPAPE